MLIRNSIEADLKGRSRLWERTDVRRLTRQAIDPESQECVEMFRTLGLRVSIGKYVDVGVHDRAFARPQSFTFSPKQGIAIEMFPYEAAIFWTRLVSWVRALQCAVRARWGIVWRP